MLVLSASSTPVGIGQSVTLSAQYGDADGNPLGAASATFRTTTPGLISIQGNTATGIAPGVAQIVATSGQYTGSLALPVGKPAAEMVVLGEAGFMSDGEIQYNGANQLQFLDNLFANPSGGTRSQGSWVAIYRGHGSLCAESSFCGPSVTTTLYSHLQSAGTTVTDLTDPSGGTAFSIPLDPKVRTLAILMPTTPFSLGEIATLKQFAIEGGRIIFLGGNANDYGDFVDVENLFLANMGSSIVANADDPWCDHPALTGGSLRPHQLTAGVTALAFGCAGSLTLGANATPVILDGNQVYVMGAVTAIDVTGATGGQAKRPAPKTSPVRRP